MQVGVGAVRLQALEAVEGVAVRSDAGRDERGCGLDGAAMGSNDGNGRVAVDLADGVGNALRLGGSQFGKAPVAISDLGCSLSKAPDDRHADGGAVGDEVHCEQAEQPDREAAGRVG